MKQKKMKGLKFKKETILNLTMVKVWGGRPSGEACANAPNAITLVPIVRLLIQVAWGLAQAYRSHNFFLTRPVSLRAGRYWRKRMKLRGNGGINKDAIEAGYGRDIISCVEKIEYTTNNCLCYKSNYAKALPGQCRRSQGTYNVLGWKSPGFPFFRR